MVTAPRVVIAAPASGHGKTTVATGLLAALAKRGTRVAGFKAGPDYIDPSYHALASGRPGRNLDPVLCPPELIAPLFAHGAAGAQVSIVEGVMGLYDGRAGAGDHGSTAEVAGLLDAPVIMVADVTAQGRSVAATLHGFRTFGTVRFGGVILNRAGSPRHEEIVREACAEIGLEVLGVLPRSAPVQVPSRHLGLIPAAEHSAEARAAVDAMAALVSAHVDLDAVLRVAQQAPPLAVTPWEPPTAEPLTRPVIAVAGGAAFTFGYVEQIELLRAAGAEVVTVDPLRDEELPPSTSGLVVGGGFPEVYGAELAANVPLRQAVARLAAESAPIAAECAGLLWLGQSVDGHEMCGVLPGRAVMTGKLTMGYRDAVAMSDSVLADVGKRVTGHEFHRTIVEPGASAEPAWAWSGAREGFVQGGVHASYLHTHWAAHPEFAARMVAACG